MISSWLLLAALAQDAAPTATPPAAAAPAQPANPLIAELAAKFAALEQAKSYAFDLETESSGGGGRKARSTADPMEIPTSRLDSDGCCRL